MVLETTLVRATDALDTYLMYSRREPSLVQDAKLRTEFDSARQSVAERLSILLSSLHPLDERVSALVEVMIAWRNRSVHSLADTEVRDAAWSTLRTNQAWLKGEFRGMEFDRLMSDFARGGAPTFKEIASFIRATQELVRQLDEAQLKRLHPRAFLKAFIWHVLSRGLPSETPSRARARLAQSTWGRDASERLKRVISTLKSNGLSPARAGSYATEFSDELLAELAEFTPGAILEYAAPPDDLTAT
jgi:hypothetical protein